MCMVHDHSSPGAQGQGHTLRSKVKSRSVRLRVRAVVCKSEVDKITAVNKQLKTVPKKQLSVTAGKYNFVLALFLKEN